MMVNQSVQQASELFKAGQQVQYSGEYNVLDEQGNAQGQDQITLDEGQGKRMRVRQAIEPYSHCPRPLFSVAL